MSKTYFYNIFLRKINLFIAGTVVFLFSAFAGLTFAQTTCQPIFGGGQTCTQGSVITVNKQVKNPQTNQFVDNLDTNGPTFQPGQSVSFRITVKNISQKLLSNINVIDVFPAFVDYAKGPGTYDPQNKTLTIPINKLDVNQSQSIDIEGVVESQDQLPTDQSKVCVANQSVVSVDNQTSDDNSRFCIANTSTKATATPTSASTPTPTSTPSLTATPTPQPNLTPTPTPLPVLSLAPIKKTPETGPEMLGLIGLIPMSAAGIFLRKKTAK